MRVAIIGAGSFGTALAVHLAGNGREVRLWARDLTLVARLNQRHENQGYLPNVKLPEALVATDDLEFAMRDAELVVMATPSHAMRQIAAEAREYYPAAPVVSVSKGIESETLATMTEVLADELAKRHHGRLAALSGPCQANDLVQQLPVSMTVACESDKVGAQVQAAFASDRLRIYTSSDLIGVQYGGALKNVVAIAAGLSDGMGLGPSSRAALITRGLAEMTRIAVKQGANPLTLAGLSGLGDLVLTCSSDQSRNRAVGLSLGRGVALSKILKSMKMVAEGIQTSKSAHQLAQRFSVELPIASEIYRICYEKKPARQAVSDLMSRALKRET